MPSVDVTARNREGTLVRGRAPLEPLLRESLTVEPFDHVLLLDEEGKVLFQSGESGLLMRKLEPGGVGEQG